MVDDYFGADLPVILDGDICSKGIESTIVGFHDDLPIIYRQGAISVDAIEFIVGKSKVQATKNEKITTPGMSPMHYAPETKFYIVESLLDFVQEHPALKIGVLTIGKSEINQPHITCINLSMTADLEEASTNLYKSMYDLDGMALDCIIIELFPEIGIGKSLNDRIRRASFR
jgi:L-threonylcarbamoyladenylate synthase